MCINYFYPKRRIADDISRSISGTNRSRVRGKGKPCASTFTGAKISTDVIKRLGWAEKRACVEF